MKIIAATDFSRPANNAVLAALKLARKFGDSVLLIRVIEPILEVHPGLRVPEASAFDAAIRQAAEAEMAKALQALPNEGVSVEGRTVIGSPARVLAAAATEEKARGIVMGSRGHGRVTRFFLGSVAERTVLEASCPVLVVPEGAAPFDQWLAGKPLRALVGVELDAATPALIAELEALRGAGPCDFTLVHTYWPPAAYARLGLRGPREMFSEDPDVVAVLERDIHDRVKLRGEGTTRLRIQSAWGRLGDTLADDAVAEKSDLVVVGTRQPHGWLRLESGSVAIGALRAARTAVLCVPAKAVDPAALAAPVPTLRHVLVPTDFSEVGNVAVAHACALLRAGGGALELLHVREQHLPTPTYEAPPVPLSPGQRAELEAQLLALAPAEAATLRIAVTPIVIDGGAPAETILQTAHRLGVDAIAMSSHGRGGVRRALLGSVTEAVVRASDKPVYVIRSPGK